MTGEETRRGKTVVVGVKLDSHNKKKRKFSDSVALMRSVEASQKRTTQEKLDPAQIEALLRGGEQVTSVLEYDHPFEPESEDFEYVREIRDDMDKMACRRLDSLVEGLYGSLP